MKTRAPYSMNQLQADRSGGCQRNSSAEGTREERESRKPEKRLAERREVPEPGKSRKGKPGLREGCSYMACHGDKGEEADLMTGRERS